MISIFRKIFEIVMFQFSFALCRCFLEDCIVVMVLSFFQTPVCSSWLGAGGWRNKSASSSHSLAIVCLISHKSKTTCPNLFELTSTKSLDEPYSFMLFSFLSSLLRIPKDYFVLKNCSNCKIHHLKYLDFDSFLPLSHFLPSCHFFLLLRN